MVITINSGTNNLDQSRKFSKVHYIPCKIHADCDSSVQKYFETSIKQGNEYQTATFRGRPLCGTDLHLPVGYTGIVLHESVRPDTDTCDRRFFVTETFDEITLWNWDRAPSAADGLRRALDWLDIAEAIHGESEGTEEKKMNGHTEINEKENEN